MVRALRPTDLTPEARIARAKRMIADAIGEMIEAYIAKGVAASEWIDQFDSPLGRHRHLRLVREGKLKATREGRKVLVRRSELNAYLDAHPEHAPQHPVEDDDVEEMMKRIAGGAESRRAPVRSSSPKKPRAPRLPKVPLGPVDEEAAAAARRSLRRHGFIPMDPKRSK